MIQVLAAFSAAAQDGPMIAARLSRDHVSSGQSTTLTVTITNAASALLSPPKVDGLRIRPIGLSRQLLAVNGQTESQVSYRYELEALRPGLFVIHWQLTPRH